MNSTACPGIIMAAGLVVSAACAPEPLDEGCGASCFTSAVVVGSAVDASGSPLAGAVLSFRVWRGDTCGLTEAFATVTGDSVAGDGGEFTAALNVPEKPFQACVVVEATTPGRESQSVAADTGLVEFRRDEPWDTLSVALRFSNGAG